MLPDRVSNPGPLTYESGAQPIALRGPAPPDYKRLEPLTDSLISVSECAVDSVTKFTSLVRARD